MKKTVKFLYIFALSLIFMPAIPLAFMFVLIKASALSQTALACGFVVLASLITASVLTFGEELKSSDEPTLEEINKRMLDLK